MPCILAQEASQPSFASSIIVSDLDPKESGFTSWQKKDIENCNDCWCHFEVIEKIAK